MIKRRGALRGAILQTLVLTLAVCVLVGGTTAKADPINPIDGSTPTNSVSFLYNSLISVSTQTADLGSGVFEYNFSFTNTDTSNIWHFIIWATASTSNAVGSLPFFDNGHSLDSVATQYDARNLDSNLTWTVHMWDTPFGGPNGVQVGANGTFAFRTSYLADSFLFGYETGASGWSQTNAGGDLAAVGTTTPIPEPSTLLLLGSGLAVLGARMRKRTKS